MNNEISNKPCGCGNCEPVCTTCGRPWIVCKGECGCKKPCCCKKKVNFCEYGRMAHGCIRERAPECPMQAVIPSVVVDNISNLKNLADCFVHVTSLNTTFYIDDKHRMIVAWAGPVEVDNYDYENNPLGLRSQTVYDFANNRAIYYNKTGGYEIFSLGGGGDTAVRLTMSYSPNSETDWSISGTASPILETSPLRKQVITLISTETADILFTNQATSEELDIDQVVDLAEDGKEVIIDNVPLGILFEPDSGTFTVGPHVDGVRLQNKATFDVDGATFHTHGGSAHVINIDAGAEADLGMFAIWSEQGVRQIAIQGFSVDSLN